ncbi:TetR/AcrR family transcriptional regulator [Candidatus Clostridium radicumherbarum]|uniref:TetR/AcrR family transcriptional regulator n=1 Tax=Candidatus Clostridium radicumherbarum TaxID=3381662 RepID=A0ABW8TQ57_9CLOT
MPKDIEKKILDAAMKVVATEKISGTRMHIIAKEAEMSQANLHYHFSSKNDIMMALLDNLQERFSEDRKSYIDIDNKAAIENIRGFFKQKKNEILNKKELDYAQFDYWVQGTVNEEVREKFQDTFNIWRKSISDVLIKGNTKGEIYLKNTDMLPYIMLSLMLGASLQYLIDEGKFDLDEYFKLSEKLLLGEN